MFIRLIRHSQSISISTEILVYLRVEGFRFLYKRQHEQQKQETKVIIIIAADAPTKTPIKTVKLE